MQQCLGENTLVDLAMGRLAHELEGAAGLHLDVCTSCREFLADLARASGSSAPRPSSILPPGTRVGRYVLGPRIGAGGMGLVYAADDPELGRRIAIKVVRGGGDSARLRLEARALAQLSSPHVVAVYDVGELGEQVFVAMELVEGETLRTFSAGKSWPQLVEAYRRAGLGLAAAHAAGLVHGDFKPDNVLIRARDGQVLVADFGLSHFGTDDDLTSGTPAYLAPEQHAGRRGDARSDQFAFCVALWEALFKERPFAGRTAKELAESTRRGALRMPQRGLAPTRLRRLLEIGLRPDPARRHPSMAALTLALARDPMRTTRRAALWLLPLLVAAAIGFVAIEKRGAPCKPTGRELAGVWDSASRPTVRAAIAATRVPFAAQMASAVERGLDRWAAQWTAMRVEACEATHLRGEQSAELLDKRMRCLDERRAEAAALLGWLSRVDAAQVRRALHGVESLGEVAWCGPRAVGERRPPAAPRRAEVAALQARLHATAARGAAGQWTAALADVRAIADSAHHTEYRPLVGDSQLLLGRALMKAGDAAGAAQALDRAAAAAEAERLDVVAAEAWTEAVYALGHGLGDTARAEAAGRHAEAAIERAGGDTRLRIRLERQLGVAAAAAGRHAAAEQRFLAALRLGQQAGGQTVEQAALHTDLGAALAAQDRLEAALVEHRAALETAERLVGAEHPMLTATLVNLANTLDGLGRSGEAVPLYRRALDIETHNGQGDSVAAANALLNLALALPVPQQAAEAEALMRRALSISEKRLGPAHAQVCSIVMNLAQLLQDEKRSREAEPLFRRSLASDEKRLGGAHPDLAPSLNGLGLSLLATGRAREAMPLFERALRNRRAALGPDDPRLAYSYEGMGEALLASGKKRQAATVLRRALTLLKNGHADPAAIAETEEQLRRAQGR